MYSIVACNRSGKWSIWRKHKKYVLVHERGRQNTITLSRLCSFCTEDILISVTKSNIYLFSINEVSLTLELMTEKRILVDIDNPPIGLIYKDAMIYILHKNYMQIYTIKDSRIHSVGVETNRI
jgi:hypothetical protein